MNTRTLPKLFIVLAVLVALAGIGATPANAANEQLVQPELPAFGKTPAAADVKAYTKKLKGRETASEKQIKSIQAKKDKLFTAINAEVEARDKARKDFLVPWLKSYRKQLIAPAHQAYSDGLRDATAVYNKAVRKARNVRKDAAEVVKKGYRVEVRAAYAQTEKEMNEARKQARKQAKKKCRAATKPKSSARRKCLKAAKHTKVSETVRTELVARLDNRLETIRDNRDAKLATAQTRFEQAEAKAAAALQKKQTALSKALEAGIAEAQKKVDATKAANEKYYQYLLDRETKKSTILKDALRAQVERLKASS